jgi:hypothetical protein
MSENGTTRVLMFCGEYEHPEAGSLDFFLEPVAFPMDVFNPRHDLLEPGEPERLVLHDKDALEAWAEEAFFAHATWEMEVPEGAIVKRPERTEEGQRWTP